MLVRSYEEKEESVSRTLDRSLTPSYRGWGLLWWQSSVYTHFLQWIIPSVSGRPQGLRPPYTWYDTHVHSEDGHYQEHQYQHAVHNSLHKWRKSMRFFKVVLRQVKCINSLSFNEKLDYTPWVRAYYQIAGNVRCASLFSFWLKLHLSLKQWA